MPVTPSELTWWPLQAALAWVFTRDDALTGELALTRVHTTVEKAIDWYEENAHRSVARLFQEADDAWLELQQAIANGSIRASGVSFDQDDEGAGRPHRGGQIKRLPPTIMGNLILAYDETNELLLRPAKWAFSGGRWYCRVSIHRQDLIENFPSGTSHIRRSFEQSRAHRRDLVERALCALYPNGLPQGLTEERRFQDVNQWIRENGEPKGVSKSTVRRAVKNLREGSKLR